MLTFADCSTYFLSYGSDIFSIVTIEKQILHNFFLFRKARAVHMYIPLEILPVLKSFKVLLLSGQQ
jgi:hypothetical protein